MITIAPTSWSGLRLVELIDGGHRNQVWCGELRGEQVAVRQSRRTAASLAWELDVIERVGRASIGVADVVSTDDGRRSADGIVVQRWIDGREPATPADWQLVAVALGRVHVIAVDQRPGATAVTELMPDSRSIDADLATLPADVRDRILAEFASFADAPTSLIHGDPGPSNIRIDADDRVHLLDWDESRIDLTWHDLSNLGVQVLDDQSHARAVRLSHAWETVNAWTTEPDYARGRYRRLLQLDDR